MDSKRYSVRINQEHQELLEWGVNNLGLAYSQVIMVAAVIGLKALRRLVEPETVISDEIYTALIEKMVEAGGVLQEPVKVKVKK